MTVMNAYFLIAFAISAPEKWKTIALFSSWLECQRASEIVPQRVEGISAKCVQGSVM